MMELYKKLTSSGIFIEWKSRNRDSFLCSYVMIQAPQFDFYNGDNTMTSFIMNNEIEIIENEEIYSKTKIKPLDLKKAASEEKAIDVVEKKYSREKFTKQIAILQNSGKQMWNLLFMTSSMKILNVKMDMNNRIISETFEPMAKFMKQVK